MEVENRCRTWLTVKRRENSSKEEVVVVKVGEEGEKRKVAYPALWLT